MSLPRYREYKDSEVWWIGSVPSHWRVDRLKASINACKNGIWGNDPTGDSDDIECVRVADFDRIRLVVAGDVPTVRSVSKREREGRLLARGDLLLEKSGGGEKQPVGQVVLYDREAPAVCSNFVAKVALAPGMVPRFWLYQHAAAYVSGVNVGAIKQTSGIQNLDQSQYFDERGVFPDEGEQRAIAAFLDRETAKIDALIAEQEKLLALLAEKRQATISHAVTRGLNPNVPMKDSGIPWLGEVPAHWEITRLKYVTDAIVDCPHETPIYDPDGDYLVIRTADLDQGVLNSSQMYRLSYEQYQDRTRRSSLQTGDVVYGREGERWGHAALVPESDRFCLGQRMMQFRPCRRMCPTFLMWQLNSVGTYRQGELDTVGATSPHVNVSTIRNFQLTLPPLDEQRAVAARLNSESKRFDELQAEAERAISLLREHRSALISAAVTGKIDVRGA